MILVNNNHIVLVENKSGEGNISSRPDSSGKLKAGIRKHYMDFLDISTNEERRQDLVDSVNNILHCKYELGLTTNSLILKNDVPIDFLFVLYDYNRRSTLFSREVGDIKEAFEEKIYDHDTRVQFIEEGDDIAIDFEKALSIYGNLPIQKAK